MKNMFRKRSKDGFTLAEVLATVAIILILAGVTFVSVVQYQKNLRLMEMDGTAKEIFIAAQNHLSLAEASGDLDRLAMQSTGTGSTSDTAYGTSISAPSYAGDTSGQYYYVIHNAAQGAGSETYIPTQGTSVYDLMLPFGALDGTVQQGGNYAIVYERKSASVVAVLYSGAGNASFGNAATIQLSDDDVKNIATIYNDKAKRKSYVKDGNTVIVGCYTGKAGSNADLDTKTLEAPKLEVKNEAKLHAVVSGNYTDNEQITLYIKGLQSGALASKTVDWKKGDTSIDITIDDITGDGKMRFTNLCGKDGSGKQRFTHDGTTPEFTVGENIEVYATVSIKPEAAILAMPKNSTTYTVSSLFGDQNSDTDTNGNTSVYIMNLRHLENLGENISGFQGALQNANSKGGNITAEQKKDLTMFTGEEFSTLNGNNIYNMSAEKTYAAANPKYTLTYKGNGNTIHDLQIGAQNQTAAGIFGESTNALTVQDLTLEDNIVSDATTTSVLVGKAESSLHISKLMLKHNQVTGTGNAGVLVGEAAASSSVDIDKVILQNDQVRDATNAAMLIGQTTAQQLNVSEVLAAYYAGKLNFNSVEEVGDYDADADSQTCVEATGSAGGLIGLVSGGQLDVSSSAASVYVKGGTAAGGFIGTVSNGVTGIVKNSYAGGHTKDGKYSTDTDGVGRYNVQATEASGVAGGFIGASTNGFTIKNVYTTASSYAPDVAKSGSFYGSGTVTIQSSYYATGIHNGAAPSDADIAKIQVSTNQAPQLAIAYDRTLLGATAEQPHPRMDTTSYPMNTIRHLRPATEGGSLPWFIMDHIGDWVVPGEEKGKADFEVENGNRLTVRINTGLNEITDDLYYQVKVHGETERFNTAYFLLHVSQSGVDVQRKLNEGNWEEYNYNIAVCKSADNSSEKVIELYLDDITNQHGHFESVVTGNYFYPGEDISVNVAPLTSSDDKDVKYDDEKTVYTNSLFGYLQNEDKDTSRHNKQKIEAVQKHFPQAGGEQNGLGIISTNEGYYVQIDNARHLENLAYSIGYSWPDDIGKNVVGAIQTDNIYWSGVSDAFTKGFQEELGSELQIWSRDKNLKSSNGNFSPIDFNANLSSYDGSNYKISGLRINENGDAGLFIHTTKETHFSNMKLENSNMVSSGGRVGGLIAYTAATAHITNVHFVNGLSVNASGVAGGFIGQINTGVDINNSGIEGDATIQSRTAAAGGAIGYTITDATITVDNVKIRGENSEIIASKNAGGLIGHIDNGKLTINNVGVSAFVTSNSTEEQAGVGGLIGYIGSPGADSTISKSYYGGRTVDGAYASNIVNETPYDANINGKRSTGGFIGYIGNGNGLAISQCFSTGSVDTQASPNTSDAYAGGFIGSGVNWGGSMSITQCYSMGKVTGTNAKTGGFIGKLSNTVTLTNAYYYCAFNNGQNARGDSPSNDGFTVLTAPSVNDILADESVDKKGESSYTAKENTHTYDHPTLQDKTYPYKNWTTEDSEGTMINTYYGDWSIIYKQMNSRLVYYHRNTWDSKTHSGSVTLTGYDTSLTTDLTNPKGNIEQDGFGIICETTKRENVH